MLAPYLLKAAFLKDASTATIGDIDNDPEGYLDESAAWLDTSKLTEFNHPGFFTVAQVAALIVAARNRSPGVYATTEDVSNALADYVMLACLDIANGELDARNPGTMLPWTQYLRMIESGMYGDGDRSPRLLWAGWCLWKKPNAGTKPKALMLIYLACGLTWKGRPQPVLRRFHNRCLMCQRLPV